MELRENVELKNYTTFFIGGPAKYLCFAQNNQDIIEALEFAEQNNLPTLIFGGGSNILVNDTGFNGLAIRVETVGMDLILETEQEVELRVASGEVWDDVVRFTCEQNWWGIENLSHIPGFTGAVPVQNVGAYGQEASQVISQVEVFDRQDKQIKWLSNSDCKFNYRTSVFNQTFKDRYVILSVDFLLSKQPSPNLSYGDLTQTFASTSIDKIAIEDIRQAIIAIRDKKFPFPSSPEKGNSGSFFCGPLLSRQVFTELINKLAERFGQEVKLTLEQMQDKLEVKQGFKTPTAFLIQLCQLKELSVGGAKINPDQPAVVVNYTGNALSTDVLSLYQQVHDLVLNQTGVNLEIEPQLVGFSVEELAKYNLSQP